MARPKKATAEYFHHYVAHGKTMYILEERFGNNGYAFWFKLLEILGATEHHFLDCRDIETWGFLLAKTRLDGIIATEILDMLSRHGSIDKDLWEHRIIWSQNFIDNLSDLYNRRRVSPYTKSDIWDLCIQKPHPTGDTADINPIITGKDSIGEESIGEERKPETPFAPGSPFSELTDKLIDDWKATSDPKPLSTLVDQARPHVRKAVEEGAKPDAIRFALKKLSMGKPPGIFASYIAEYFAQGEKPPGTEAKLLDQAKACPGYNSHDSCVTEIEGKPEYAYCNVCPKANALPTSRAGGG